MPPPSKKRRTQNAPVEEDIMEHIQNLVWCKSEWVYPDVGEETKEFLKKCGEQVTPENDYTVEDILKKSEESPVKFPIQTVRLKELKKRRPDSRLKRNINSTYTVIHERVLILMANFLLHKRKYGSDIEKALYKDMDIPQFIERILKKRAVAFLTAKDKYLLISGNKGADGWEAVGTPDEKPPLVLADCLSYDEMKISAMVYVSGYTDCINDGARKNSGVVRDDDLEQEAVIIGVIGSRFKREGRMDCEDILITSTQNTRENGYGDSDAPRSAWRRLWANFFQEPSRTYGELSSMTTENRTKDKQYLNRYVQISQGVYFDNKTYYRRTVILIETTLTEANYRGREVNQGVFLNVIGAGLGVWKASKHQEDVFLLAFIERVKWMLDEGLLNFVADVNFAYIKPGRSVAGLLKTSKCGDKEIQKVFIENKEHPRGGISIQFESREPTAKLPPEHEDKLLVITYPWDGNAHPGNEFWIGKLGSSGDPAAACSTQVSELHNAHINPALSGMNVRVAHRGGPSTLEDCCYVITE